MDTQLQDIITRIHDEGVKGAEERARHIVEAAEKQAQERTECARAEADAMRNAAEQEAAKMRAAGEAALKQASRDLLLSVKKELERLFELVQKEAVGEALTPDRMAETIQSVVTSWVSGKGDSLDILASPGDRDALEAALKRRLADKLQSGCVVRPVRGIGAGFRVGVGDSAAFLDFTDETIAELLAAYLNPRLSELMRDVGRA